MQNLDALSKTEGFNIPILPEDSFWKMQFESGQPIYFWIPLGLLAVGLALVIAVRRSSRPASASRPSATTRPPLRRSGSTSCGTG